MYITLAQGKIVALVVCSFSLQKDYFSVLDLEISTNFSDVVLRFFKYTVAGQKATRTLRGQRLNLPPSNPSVAVGRLILKLFVQRHYSTANLQRVVYGEAKEEGGQQGADELSLGGGLFSVKKLAKDGR